MPPASQQESLSAVGLCDGAFLASFLVQVRKRTSGTEYHAGCQQIYRVSLSPSSLYATRRERLFNYGLNLSIVGLTIGI